MLLGGGGMNSPSAFIVLFTTVRTSISINKIKKVKSCQNNKKKESVTKSVSLESKAV